MTPRPVRRWPVAVASALALVVGLAAATLLVVVFTVLDDNCPAFASEGTSAAPGSPYARVMCDSAVTLLDDTMSQVPVPWVMAAAAAPGGAAALWLVWRRPRLAGRRQVAAVLAGVLLAPPLVAGAAHLALPRDCLGGRTAAGDCSRDRELS